MPDISMCRNKTCTKKEACYRYSATPSQRQSYTHFKHEEGECAFFIKIDEKVENGGAVQAVVRSPPTT